MQYRVAYALDWLVRITYLALCFIAAVLITNGIRHRPDRDDWLVAIALTFGIHALLQVAFRYAETPAIEIRVGVPSRAQLGPYPTQPTRTFAVLYLDVHHREVPPFIRPIVSRRALERCRLEVRYTLTHPGPGKTQFQSTWLPCRWEENQEPASNPSQAFALMSSNRFLARLYPYLKESSSPAPARAAFAMKELGISDAYHFNDESYRFGFGWKNPAWVLPRGTFRLDVRLSGHGIARHVETAFTVRNTGPNLSDWAVEA